MERNFADVLTRCSSLLQGKSEVSVRRLEHLVEASVKFLSVGIQRACFRYARANREAPSSFIFSTK